MTNSELLLLYLFSPHIKTDKFVISKDNAVCRNIVLEKLRENSKAFSDSGLSRLQQELILN